MSPTWNPSENQPRPSSPKSKDWIFSCSMPVSRAVHQPFPKMEVRSSSQRTTLAMPCFSRCRFFSSSRLPPVPPPQGDVRVISLASVGYKNSKTIQFDTLKDPEQILNPQVVSPIQRYCQSKLANLLHAREAAKRLPQCLKIVSLDPGGVQTGLLMREPGDKQEKGWKVAGFMSLWARE
ncbi:Retinol dehydrogenase 12 [Cytospora mali]|uniref:Retinol dehydrogenase 12 n=1 Tax=Cytospora mali TaxID=578113 RepID=A0A194VY86_CYTMA|nr:Retinol dehydrogenase 12 [Valsa mali]